MDALVNEGYLTLRDLLKNKEMLNLDDIYEIVKQSISRLKSPLFFQTIFTLYKSQMLYSKKLKRLMYYPKAGDDTFVQLIFKDQIKIYAKHFDLPPDIKLGIKESRIGKSKDDKRMLEKEKKLDENTILYIWGAQMLKCLCKYFKIDAECKEDIDYDKWMVEKRKILLEELKKCNEMNNDKGSLITKAITKALEKENKEGFDEIIKILNKE